MFASLGVIGFFSLFGYITGGCLDKAVEPVGLQKRQLA